MSQPTMRPVPFAPLIEDRHDGGNLLIQGMIARLMYTSLYKLHQISIHGFVRVLFDTLGRFLRERLEPRVKLH